MLARSPVLTFQQEGLLHCFEEAETLTRAHWDEICSDKARMELNPDRDAYARLDAAGAIVCTTARLRPTPTHRGELAGYLVFILGPHLHYRHVTVAHDDLHYLRPDLRQGMNGVRLLKHGIDAAKAAGAHLVLLRCKAAQDHGAIFTALGFQPMDRIFSKWMN
jgi:hypothetical protein